VSEERDLHDEFEPQAGDWVSLYGRAQEHAILTHALIDTIARYRRTILIPVEDYRG
jgi:hypothetical protein